MTKISKDNFKKGLIALGVASVLAGGIVYHFSQQKDYMTYEEYIATIEVYNAKLKEIRNDCTNDIRCIENKEGKQVLFKEIRCKEDIIKKLNKWIELDKKDPTTYKKVKEKKK